MLVISDFRYMITDIQLFDGHDHLLQCESQGVYYKDDSSDNIRGH